MIIQNFEKWVELLLKVKQEFKQLRKNAYLKLFFLDCDHLNAYFIHYMDDIKSELVANIMKRNSQLLRAYVEYFV